MKRSARLATSLALSAPLAAASLAAAPQAPGDTLPLALWTDALWPGGLDVGQTRGITFGDYDGDGWVDLYAGDSGRLLRNLEGRSWELEADLDVLMPPAFMRYGASFGDYDADGLPDLAIETRNNTDCLHLLKNLGGGPNFVDVAGEPSIVDVQPCGAGMETFCWADVDGDGRLDLFAPAYLPHGNFFFHNLGAAGPEGRTRLAEKRDVAGLDVTPGANRPEGAQFADVDLDGDLDLYCNGTLYRNVSTPGAPRFEPLAPAASGIGHRAVLDEGALFLDADLDGDLDLVVSYVPEDPAIVLWLARGDGTFAAADPGVVEDHQKGRGLGLSAADWDGDGDLDLQTKQVFRRNLRRETGALRFTILDNPIPKKHRDQATPAWADWDGDGDLDCLLANFEEQGRLYENTLHDRATPLDVRRDLRVRALGDSPAVPAGLETEYGAVAEVRVRGEEDGPRRRALSASSAGYVNQDAYDLWFALPPDPFPADPERDVRFDLAVDFANPGGAGVWRVDGATNPVLAGLDLARLGTRRVAVFRSGRVDLEGCTFAPSAPEPFAAQGPPLVAPPREAALPRPIAAPGPDHFVGLDLVVGPSDALVHEVVLDGELAAPATCGPEPFDLALWDVTVPGQPVLAAALARAPAPANDRVRLPVALVLRAGRSYRLVARVARLRASPLAAPATVGPLTVTGGLAFDDPTPCTGAAVEAAPSDPGRVSVALVARPYPRQWIDLGQGLAGAAGTPVLAAAGAPFDGQPLALALTGAAPNAPVVLVGGRTVACRPLRGGHQVPAAEHVLTGLATDASGALAVSVTWPDATALGEPFFVQAWIADPSATGGAASTNAMGAVRRD